MPVLAARSAAILGCRHRGMGDHARARDPSARGRRQRPRGRAGRRRGPVLGRLHSAADRLIRRDHRLDASGTRVALAAASTCRRACSGWAPRHGRHRRERGGPSAGARSSRRPSLRLAGLERRPAAAVWWGACAVASRKAVEDLDHARRHFGEARARNILWPLDSFLNEAAGREQNLNQFVIVAGTAADPVGGSGHGGRTIRPDGELVAGRVGEMEPAPAGERVDRLDNQSRRPR